MKPCLPLCCVLVAFLAGQSLAHSVPTAQSVTSPITQNTLLDDEDLVDVGTDDSSRVRRSGLTGLINKKLHFIGKELLVTCLVPVRAVLLTAPHTVDITGIMTIITTSMRQNIMSMVCFGSSAYASAQASHSSSHAHDLTHHEAPHHYVAPSYSAPAPTYTSPSGGAAFPYPPAGVSDFDYGSNYGAKVTRGGQADNSRAVKSNQIGSYHQQWHSRYNVICPEF
ncbi:uncharacterized protein LOC113469689 [Diaphorina citri]|uniref:Uncharacterized protein LOC113469689 n=1 Tax=Diaphorina citri TaxID=121845 RepID=A0A3Q0J8S4_DIACI|nr:uncharacterized protein LOC113469689 [Diaphorina citri]